MADTSRRVEAPAVDDHNGKTEDGMSPPVSETAKYSPKGEDSRMSRTPVDNSTALSTSTTLPSSDITSDGHGKIGENVQKNKEKEERIRLVREKQQEELKRKMEGLREANSRSEEFRKRLEEDRKRRAEKMRQTEEEHRVIVENRRKRILEEENERRMALIQKTMQRDVKLEQVKPKKAPATSTSVLPAGTLSDGTISSGGRSPSRQRRPHSVAGRLPSYASPTVASQCRMARGLEKTFAGNLTVCYRCRSAPPDLRLKSSTETAAAGSRPSRPTVKIGLEPVSHSKSMAETDEIAIQKSPILSKMASAPTKPAAIVGTSLVSTKSRSGSSAKSPVGVKSVPALKSSVLNGSLDGIKSRMEGESQTKLLPISKSSTHNGTTDSVKVRVSADIKTKAPLEVASQKAPALTLVSSFATPEHKSHESNKKGMLTTKEANIKGTVDQSNILTKLEMKPSPTSAVSQKPPDSKRSAERGKKSAVDTKSSTGGSPLRGPSQKGSGKMVNGAATLIKETPPAKTGASKKSKQGSAQPSKPSSIMLATKDTDKDNATKQHVAQKESGDKKEERNGTKSQNGAKTKAQKEISPGKETPAADSGASKAASQAAAASENEYKAKLAEKRRLAREKAELDTAQKKQKEEYLLKCKKEEEERKEEERKNRELKRELQQKQKEEEKQMEIKRKEEQKKKKEIEQKEEDEKKKQRMEKKTKEEAGEDEKKQMHVEEKEERTKESDMGLHEQIAEPPSVKKKEALESKLKDEAESREKVRTDKAKREEEERIERKKRLEDIMKRVKPDESKILSPLSPVTVQRGLPLDTHAVSSAVLLQSTAETDEAEESHEITNISDIPESLPVVEVVDQSVFPLATYTCDEKVQLLTSLPEPSDSRLSSAEIKPAIVQGAVQETTDFGNKDDKPMEESIITEEKSGLTVLMKQEIVHPTESAEPVDRMTLNNEMMKEHRKEGIEKEDLNLETETEVEKPFLKDDKLEERLTIKPKELSERTVASELEQELVVLGKEPGERTAFEKRDVFEIEPLERRASSELSEKPSRVDKEPGGKTTSLGLVEIPGISGREPHDGTAVSQSLVKHDIFEEKPPEATVSAELFQKLEQQGSERTAKSGSLEKHDMPGKDTHEKTAVSADVFKKEPSQVTAVSGTLEQHGQFEKEPVEKTLGERSLEKYELLEQEPSEKTASAGLFREPDMVEKDHIERKLVSELFEKHDDEKPPSKETAVPGLLEKHDMFEKEPPERTTVSTDLFGKEPSQSADVLGLIEKPNLFGKESVEGRVVSGPLEKHDKFEKEPGASELFEKSLIIEKEPNEKAASAGLFQTLDVYEQHSKETKGVSVLLDKHDESEAKTTSAMLFQTPHLLEKEPSEKSASVGLHEKCEMFETESSEKTSFDVFEKSGMSELLGPHLSEKEPREITTSPGLLEKYDIPQTAFSSSDIESQKTSGSLASKMECPESLESGSTASYLNQGLSEVKQVVAEEAAKSKTSLVSSIKSDDLDLPESSWISKENLEEMEKCVESLPSPVLLTSAEQTGVGKSWSEEFRLEKEPFIGRSVETALEMSIDESSPSATLSDLSAIEVTVDAKQVKFISLADDLGMRMGDSSPAQMRSETSSVDITRSAESSITDSVRSEESSTADVTRSEEPAWGDEECASEGEDPMSAEGQKRNDLFARLEAEANQAWVTEMEINQYPDVEEQRETEMGQDQYPEDEDQEEEEPDSVKMVKENKLYSVDDLGYPGKVSSPGCDMARRKTQPAVFWEPQGRGQKRNSEVADMVEESTFELTSSSKIVFGDNREKIDLGRPVQSPCYALEKDILSLETGDGDIPQHKDKDDTGPENMTKDAVKYDTESVKIDSTKEQCLKEKDRSLVESKQEEIKYDHSTEQKYKGFSIHDEMTIGVTTGVTTEMKHQSDVIPGIKQEETVRIGESGMIIQLEREKVAEHDQGRLTGETRQREESMIDRHEIFAEGAPKEVKKELTQDVEDRVTDLDVDKATNKEGREKQLGHEKGEETVKLSHEEIVLQGGREKELRHDKNEETVKLKQEEIVQHEETVVVMKKNKDFSEPKHDVVCEPLVVKDTSKMTCAEMAEIPGDKVVAEMGQRDRITDEEKQVSILEHSEAKKGDEVGRREEISQHDETVLSKEARLEKVAGDHDLVSETRSEEIAKSNEFVSREVIKFESSAPTEVLPESQLVHDQSKGIMVARHVSEVDNGEMTDGKRDGRHVDDAADETSKIRQDILNREKDESVVENKGKDIVKVETDRASTEISQEVSSVLDTDHGIARGEHDQVATSTQPGLEYEVPSQAKPKSMSEMGDNKTSLEGVFHDEDVRLRETKCGEISTWEEDGMTQEIQDGRIFKDKEFEVDIREVDIEVKDNVLRPDDEFTTKLQREEILRHEKEHTGTEMSCRDVEDNLRITETGKNKEKKPEFYDELAGCEQVTKIEFGEDVEVSKRDDHTYTSFDQRRTGERKVDPSCSITKMSPVRGDDGTKHVLKYVLESGEIATPSSSRQLEEVLLGNTTSMDNAAVVSVKTDISVPSNTGSGQTTESRLLGERTIPGTIESRSDVPHFESPVSLRNSELLLGLSFSGRPSTDDASSTSNVHTSSSLRLERKVEDLIEMERTADVTDVSDKLISEISDSNKEKNKVLDEPDRACPAKSSTLKEHKMSERKDSGHTLPVDTITSVDIGDVQISVGFSGTGPVTSDDRPTAKIEVPVAVKKDNQEPPVVASASSKDFDQTKGKHDHASEQRERFHTDDQELSRAMLEEAASHDEYRQMPEPKKHDQDVDSSKCYPTSEKEIYGQDVVKENKEELKEEQIAQVLKHDQYSEEVHHGLSSGKEELGQDFGKQKQEHVDEWESKTKDQGKRQKVLEVENDEVPVAVKKHEQEQEPVLEKQLYQEVESKEESGICSFGVFENMAEKSFVKEEVGGEQNLKGDEPKMCVKDSEQAKAVLRDSVMHAEQKFYEDLSADRHSMKLEDVAVAEGLQQLEHAKKDEEQKDCAKSRSSDETVTCHVANKTVENLEDELIRQAIEEKFVENIIKKCFLEIAGESLGDTGKEKETKSVEMEEGEKQSEGLDNAEGRCDITAKHLQREKDEICVEDLERRKGVEQKKYFESAEGKHETDGKTDKLVKSTEYMTYDEDEYSKRCAEDAEKEKCVDDFKGEKHCDDRMMKYAAEKEDLEKKEFDGGLRDSDEKHDVEDEGEKYFKNSVGKKSGDSEKEKKEKEEREMRYLIDSEQAKDAGHEERQKHDVSDNRHFMDFTSDDDVTGNKHDQDVKRRKDLKSMDDEKYRKVDEGEKYVEHDKEKKYIQEVTEHIYFMKDEAGRLVLDEKKTDEFMELSKFDENIPENKKSVCYMKSNEGSADNRKKKCVPVATPEKCYTEFEEKYDFEEKEKHGAEAEIKFDSEMAVSLDACGMEHKDEDDDEKDVESKYDTESEEKRDTELKVKSDVQDKEFSLEEKYDTEPKEKYDTQLREFYYTGQEEKCYLELRDAGTVHQEKVESFKPDATYAEENLLKDDDKLVEKNVEDRGQENLKDGTRTEGQSVSEDAQKTYVQKLEDIMARHSKRSGSEKADVASGSDDTVKDSGKSEDFTKDACLPHSDEKDQEIRKTLETAGDTTQDKQEVQDIKQSGKSDDSLSKNDQKSMKIVAEGEQVSVGAKHHDSGKSKKDECGDFQSVSEVVTEVHQKSEKIDSVDSVKPAEDLEKSDIDSQALQEFVMKTLNEVLSDYSQVLKEAVSVDAKTSAGKETENVQVSKDADMKLSEKAEVVEPKEVENFKEGLEVKKVVADHSRVDEGEGVLASVSAQGEKGFEKPDVIGTGVLKLGDELIGSQKSGMVHVEVSSEQSIVKTPKKTDSMPDAKREEKGLMSDNMSDTKGEEKGLKSDKLSDAKKEEKGLMSDSISETKSEEKDLMNDNISDAKREEKGLMSDTKREEKGLMSDAKREEKGLISDNISDTKREEKGLMSDNLSDTKREEKGLMSDTKREEKGLMSDNISDTKREEKGLMSDNLSDTKREKIGLLDDNFKVMGNVPADNSCDSLGSLKSDTDKGATLHAVSDGKLQRSDIDDATICAEKSGDPQQSLLNSDLTQDVTVGVKMSPERSEETASAMPLVDVASSSPSSIDFKKEETIDFQKEELPSPSGDLPQNKASSDENEIFEGEETVEIYEEIEIRQETLVTKNHSRNLAVTLENVITEEKVEITYTSPDEKPIVFASSFGEFGYSAEVVKDTVFETESNNGPRVPDDPAVSKSLDENLSGVSALEQVQPLVKEGGSKEDYHGIAKDCELSSGLESLDSKYTEKEEKIQEVLHSTKEHHDLEESVKESAEFKQSVHQDLPGVVPGLTKVKEDIDILGFDRPIPRSQFVDKSSDDLQTKKDNVSGGSHSVSEPSDHLEQKEDVFSGANRHIELDDKTQVLADCAPACLEESSRIPLDESSKLSESDSHVREKNLATEQKSGVCLSDQIIEDPSLSLAKTPSSKPDQYQKECEVKDVDISESEFIKDPAISQASSRLLTSSPLEQECAVHDLIISQQKQEIRKLDVSQLELKASGDSFHSKQQPVGTVSGRHLQDLEAQDVDPLLKDHRTSEQDIKDHQLCISEPAVSLTGQSKPGPEVDDPGPSWMVSCIEDSSLSESDTKVKVPNLSWSEPKVRDPVVTWSGSEIKDHGGIPHVQPEITDPGLSLLEPHIDKPSFSQKSQNLSHIEATSSGDVEEHISADGRNNVKGLTSHEKHLGVCDSKPESVCQPSNDEFRSMKCLDKLSSDPTSEAIGKEDDKVLLNRENSDKVGKKDCKDDQKNIDKHLAAELKSFEKEGKEKPLQCDSSKSVEMKNKQEKIGVGIAQRRDSDGAAKEEMASASTVSKTSEVSVVAENVERSTRRRASSKQSDDAFEILSLDSAAGSMSFKEPGIVGFQSDRPPNIPLTAFYSENLSQPVDIFHSTLHETTLNEKEKWVKPSSVSLSSSGRREDDRDSQKTELSKSFGSKEEFVQVYAISGKESYQLTASPAHSKDEQRRDPENLDAGATFRSYGFYDQPYKTSESIIPRNLGIFPSFGTRTRSDSGAGNYQTSTDDADCEKGASVASESFISKDVEKSAAYPPE